MATGHALIFANKVDLKLARQAQHPARRRLPPWEIRPEHLNPTAAKAGDCQGVIKVVEQLGDNTYLYVDVDGLGLVNMRVSPMKNYVIDDQIGISFDGDFCHLFCCQRGIIARG